jgi:hypothetical protein
LWSLRSGITLFFVPTNEPAPLPADKLLFEKQSLEIKRLNALSRRELRLKKRREWAQKNLNR